MHATDRAAAAAELAEAYTSGVPIEPLTGRYDGLDLADAYEIQLLQMRWRFASGRRVIGHKVGLTSPAMQKQMQVDQPDYGHLTDDMIFVENLPVPYETYLQPRVEPEIAFVLKKPLQGPGVTVPEAIAAVDFVLPAIEIIDSRIRDWKIGILDTIADNASSGGIVLGSSPVPVDDVDLRLGGCVLHRNGEVVGTGAGGAVLGSPITSLAWLANTVGAVGVVLEAGHVVLPGSITASVPVAPGDTFTATFAGIGSVTTRFTRPSANEPEEVP